MRRLVSVDMKVAPIIMALFGLALGTSVVLTDPDPEKFPLGARRWLAAKSARPDPPPTAGRAGLDEVVPLFTDSPFDDGGFAASIRFSKPIPDRRPWRSCGTRPGGAPGARLPER